MADFRRGSGSPLRQRPRPLWMVILAHALALGVALVLYALPHHVIPRQGRSIGVTSTRAAAQATPEPAVQAPAEAKIGSAADGEAASPAGAPEPAAEAHDAPTDAVAQAPIVGNFREKFAGHFTSGEVERTDTTYRSENLDITISTTIDEAIQSHIYVADIYIADISCLQTAFAKDTYGNGYAEPTPTIGKRHQSILTINGDYYGTRDGGVVIRNGTLYRDEKNVMDLCVLYWDGTMKTFPAYGFDAQAEMKNGAYQCWCFGPLLLDGEGRAMTSFSSKVNKSNPRSVIGYYEPGHYCFVAVDARSDDDKGATTAELARIMENLGCKQAYNLDGGRSSVLVAGGTVINNPSRGGRKISDVIMILDQVTQ